MSMKSQDNVPSDKQFVAAIAFVFFLFVAAGAAIGAGIEVSQRGSCEYASLAAYFPPHLIVCELFAQRWKREAIK